MNRIYLTGRTLAILMLVVILAACSTPTVVVQPTQDIPAVRTEVAKTVVAKVTIEAALNPSATPAAAQVMVVTATPDAAAPTATKAASAATLVPTLRPATGGVSGGFIKATSTRRAGPDLAQILAQEPGDGARYNAGVSFDAKFTFKNTGTSTWTNGFEYRFASGTNLSDRTRYTVPATVKPGETVTLVIDMLAPASAGRYTSHWELVNINGDVFYQFFVVIDVNQ